MRNLQRPLARVALYVRRNRTLGNTVIENAVRTPFVTASFRHHKARIKLIFPYKRFGADFEFYPFLFVGIFRILEAVFLLAVRFRFFKRF